MSDKEEDIGKMLLKALFGRGSCEHQEALEKTCAILGALAVRQGGRMEIDVAELEDLQGSGKAVAIHFEAAQKRVVVQVIASGRAPQPPVAAPSSDSKH